MGLTFLGKILFDPNMVVCGDAGTCYRDVHNDSKVTAVFDDLAGKIARLII
jgi:hypothetical protein